MEQRTNQKALAQLPAGNAPEFDLLRLRVETALRISIESPGLEFKTGLEWGALAPQITRAVLAMSNLQDGGLIIVGHPEDQGLAEGVTPEQLETYDPDAMRDHFDAFASPSAIVNLVAVEVNGATYVATEVLEFTDLPVVCKKNHGNAPHFFLRAGAFYIRPTNGRPRSTAIENAEEMRSLINLAVDKSFSRFEEQTARRGFARVQNDTVLYDEELGDIN